MQKHKIITRAEDCCSLHNINRFPVGIVTICKSYGITVFEKYLPSEVSGFIVIQKEDFQNYGTGKLIVANLSDPPTRRRFTIAHELAHYILHKKPEEELFAHRDAGENSGIEQEANIFASNVLMPEKLVRDAISQLRRKKSYKNIPRYIMIDYISKNFAVSGAAAEVRLDQLKIF